MRMDYDALAAEAYARNRRASEHVITELRTFCPLGPSSRVLEVGCGTANHILALIEATGCVGWGIEPSEEMRHRAPIRGQLTICEGSAESIPFENDFFNLQFSVNVIHHVLNVRDHFKESLRVLKPGAWICTFTDSTDMIRRREPLSRYWPLSAEADIGRYPTVDGLLDAMREAGFENLTRREIRNVSHITDSTPYREKAFSCLRLVDDSHFKDGLLKLEADLRNGPVLRTSEFVSIWGAVPAIGSSHP